MRIGVGYDIHKLEEGRRLILGGVEIPHTKGFIAHSDGDVLVHSIIDAILGALGKRDIGVHFSDSDPKYKDINSLELLNTICKMYDFKIINIDSNIICEEPKLKPYINKMKENLSDILNIDPNLISIKAKTNEGLDSVGEKRAISANCTLLLEEG